MITIVCDFYQLHKVEIGSDVVVVNSIQDYIPLRQQLRRILDIETRDYTVYVQHRVIAQWLTDLTSYDPYIVKWAQYNHQYQIFFEHSWRDAAATVLPRREQTRDGAIPEKVAVPSIGSQSAKINFIDPIVKLTGFLQLHRVGTLSITIENTNI